MWTGLELHWQNLASLSIKLIKKGLPVPDLYVDVVRLCASLGMVGLGHIAFDGTKLKANASVRQTRDRDGLEKEIVRIKEQMRQMIQASANIDGLEDLIYPDGDGSEIAAELRKKGCGARTGSKSTRSVATR